MERILSIEEGNFDGKSGFIVKTNEQEILLGIQDDQYCCELWGYFMSEDDFSRFIGAELLGVKVVDTALRTWDAIENMYEGGTMFVNIETSNGLLQFAAYNEHNGFYGHEAMVQSKQLTRQTYL